MTENRSPALGCPPAGAYPVDAGSRVERLGPPAEPAEILLGVTVPLLLKQGDQLRVQIEAIGAEFHRPPQIPDRQPDIEIVPVAQDLGHDHQRRDRVRHASEHIAEENHRLRRRRVVLRSEPEQEAGAGKQDARREGQTPRQLQVGHHAFWEDPHIPDDAGEQIENVVDRQRRVRQDHPLRRRVADVPLVPQGDVIERCDGVPAHQSRQTANTLAEFRIALVGHRRRTCAHVALATEWLFDLPNLGALQRSDFGRKFIQGRRNERKGLDELGVTVALDDLVRDRRRRQAKFPARRFLYLRGHAGVCPDRAGKLADSDDIPRLRQPLLMAAHLVPPKGELEPETHRLGVDTVRAAHRRGVDELFGAPSEGVHQGVDIGVQQVDCLDELETQRRVFHIIGRQAMVDPAPFWPKTCHHRAGEGDDIVLRFVKVAVVQAHVEPGAADQLHIWLGNDSHVRPRLAGGDLHV